MLEERPIDLDERFALGALRLRQKIQNICFPAAHLLDLLFFRAVRSSSRYALCSMPILSFKRSALQVKHSSSAALYFSTQSLSLCATLSAPCQFFPSSEALFKFTLWNAKPIPPG